MMNKMQCILKEIDQGIETIKTFLPGETRQIAECQIIGLEEAKKIVEKYEDQTEVTQEGDVKRIKLFPAPHIELRIHASEQMIKDYEECGRLDKETSEGKNCNTCSWKDVSIGDVGMCKLIERMLNK